MIFETRVTEYKIEKWQDKGRGHKNVGYFDTREEAAKKAKELMANAVCLFGYEVASDCIYIITKYSEEDECYLNPTLGKENIFRVSM